MIQELSQEFTLSRSSVWPGAPQRMAWLSFPLTPVVSKLFLIYNSRSYKHSLYPFALGMGLDCACVYRWWGPESVITVLCCPCSNPDLRRIEPVLESSLQRTSSGSSSSSSTPSSQPSSQGGSQPGSQAGSSERTRVRGKAFPYLYPTAWPGRGVGAGSQVLLTSVTSAPDGATTVWHWKAV